MDKGYLVISQDFELIYGVIDHLTDEDPYYENIDGVRKVVPMTLELFKKYSIAATWGTVGMLFNKNKEELLKNLPEKRPQYQKKSLSVYNHLAEITPGKEQRFFARDLIDMISSYPNQEIGTHTYEHYFCTEPGQTEDEFEADIKQAIKITKASGYKAPESLIFPRNMFNAEYLRVLEENNIRFYRGNLEVWYDKVPDSLSFMKRGFRLLDSYFNIAGHECYELKKEKVTSIPASRFLYPYGKIPHMDGLKLRRIKAQMRYAAKHRKVFHLWWHPHNFGRNIEQNLQTLKEILKYYTVLHKKYGMESVNMKMLGKMI